MITIEPDRAHWAAALSKAGVGGFNLDQRAARFRDQLGLPTDRPIVMSGHQAIFWHPGILAKYFAMHAAARAYNAQPVWLVVDQDAHDPFEVRYPALDAVGRVSGPPTDHPLASDGQPEAHRAQTLSVHSWRADGFSPAAWSARFEHVSTSRIPPIKPAELPSDLALAAAPNVQAGLQHIRAALIQAQTAPTAAAQVAWATHTLLDPLTPGVKLLYATALARTDLFNWFIDQMQADPDRCYQTYQQAVRAHPNAGVAPLAANELPLWRLPAGPTPRQRVDRSQLAATPQEELAPRALLMTAMLRLAGCELFIHGTGGAGSDASTGYDAITQDWLSSWLGLTLAPMALATATLHLRIATAQPPITTDQITRAAWKAHSARHNPGLLDDPAAEARKRELLQQLRPLVGKRSQTPAQRRPRRIEALAIYKQLHALLAQTRAKHTGELAEIDALAQSAAARRAEAEIIGDRTWAFPLYETDQLQALKQAVDDWFKA